jgi:peptidoglycan hydrolase CwlO-like protein
MSSEVVDDIQKQLEACQDEIGTIYRHLDEISKMARAHHLQIRALHESIMSLPVVKENKKLQKEIKARFDEIEIPEITNPWFAHINDMKT